jgi:hypothetical protein
MAPWRERKGKQLRSMEERVSGKKVAVADAAQ